MAASYQEHTEAGSGSVTSGPLVGNKPAGTAEGDLLLAFFCTRRNSSAVHSAPSGWTQIGSSIGQGLLTISAWWKLAGSSEPSTYTFSWTGSTARTTLSIVRYTGHHAETPLDVVDVTQTISGTATAPSIATTVDDALVVRALVKEREGELSSSPGLTERWGFGVGGSSGSGQYGEDVVQATAGATGTQSWTFSNGDRDHAAWTISIAPAAGGGGTNVDESFSLALSAGDSFSGIAAALGGISAGMTVTAGPAAGAQSLASVSLSLASAISQAAAVTVQGAITLAAQVATSIAAGATASDALLAAVQGTLGFTDIQNTNVNEAFTLALQSAAALSATGNVQSAVTLAVLGSLTAQEQVSVISAVTLAIQGSLSHQALSAAQGAISLGISASAIPTITAQLQAQLTLAVVNTLVAQGTNIAPPEVLLAIAERLLKPSLSNQSLIHPQS